MQQGLQTGLKNGSVILGLRFIHAYVACQDDDIIGSGSRVMVLWISEISDILLLCQRNRGSWSLDRAGFLFVVLI